MTLSARLTASYKFSKFLSINFKETPKEYKKNITEVKVGKHLCKIMERLRYMEHYKTTKPKFSQACDLLFERVKGLL